MDAQSPLESLAGAQQGLNVVCGFVAYGPADPPHVEVLVSSGDEAPHPDWMPGDLRMHTEHVDGALTYTVQYLRQGRLFIDNLSEDRVRGVQPG